ncbi:MAG: hypothetical protein ABSC94_26495 [Polyangiaceae bacterium]|jgi:hypothetical protein
MSAAATREFGDLKSAVDGIADRFVTGRSGNATIRQVRELADELVLDLIAAMRNASLVELAETIDVLERRRNARAAARPAAAPREATVRSKSRSRPTPARPVDEPDEHEPEPSAEAGAARRSAFDITQPSELLDHVARSTPRNEEQPPSSVRRMRPSPPEILSPPRANAPPTGAAGKAPVAATEPEATAWRAPTVSLREGEQVLRASGSGVVIRRVRA